MRWLRYSLVALLGVLLLLVGAAWLLMQRSLAEPGGSHMINGLGASVQIRFDARLRPWVTAGSLADAVAAEGWLHARYRLWQMELLRRAGRGRLAEAFGEPLLDTDRALWRAGVPQLAERLERTASAGLLRLVDHYVAGVNAGIGSLRARPPEFWLLGLRPADWTRKDVFAVGALIAFQSANNSDNELLRLALAEVLDTERFSLFVPQDPPANYPYVLGREAAVDLTALDALDPLAVALLPGGALGSSSWAIAPSRSASGNALFAFDSHDDLTLPNLFYEIHLFYGEGRSVQGASLPGLPGVINGWNGRLAWGMTNIGDTQDLYLERPHPERPDTFLHAGSWYPAERETVSIPVAGRESPAELVILRTRNGPLISEQPPLALRWTGHDLQGRGLEALIAMNTADDWSAFEAALDRHGAPSANIVYADVTGRIAFRTIGLIPQRGAGRGLLPLAGDDPDNAWQGHVPDRNLPRAVDPPAAFLAAANARVTPGPPLVSADNAPGYRMRRLHEILAGRTDFRAADMQRLQLDTRNSQAALLLPHMLPALDGYAPGSRAAAAREILAAWARNPHNDADAPGALVWEHWYPALAETVFGAALGRPLLQRLLARNYVLNDALDRLVSREHDSPWWQGRREALLRDAFSLALQRVEQAAGTDPSSWRWDAAHTVSFRHELGGAVTGIGAWLDRGPYPWGGGHPVLARARYRYDRPFEGRMGATIRVVIEMQDRPRASTIMPGGQHGHPASPHYADQLPEWLEGRLESIAGEAADVRGPVTVLVPGG